MNILVLDTIHGGADIAAAYERAGHRVDSVDIYRGTTPAEEIRATTQSYDLVVAPVHMDPGHPLLARRTCPVITHHEAVRSLLGEQVPDLMVDDLVIVDPKVVDAFNDTHLRQMIGYLAITKLKLALLLNFKHAKLQWKRVVREAEE